MFFEAIEITLILAMLVAFFASGMTAYAGFGGALVMVPLFTLMIGPIQAIALTGLCNSIALLHVLPRIISVVQWKEVVPLFAGLLIAVSVSADFIVSADQSLIQMCIGIFVLLAALFMIMRFALSGTKRTNTKFWNWRPNRSNYGGRRGSGWACDGYLLHGCARATKDPTR